VKKQILTFVIVFAVLLTVDLVTKYLTYGNHAVWIPNLLEIVSVRNFGIAFGLFSGVTWLFIVINSILTLVAIVAWWFYGRKNKGMNIGFAFFVCGAVGNLFDRIAFGYVRDFIHVPFFPPVFNFADIWLTIGTMILVVLFVVASFKKIDKGIEK